VRTLYAPTALAAAVDAERFGGKAAQLATALSAGLPVPGGWALGWSEVAALAAGDAQVAAAVRATVAGCGPVAVRSSAVGEDSSAASFAGAHLSVLGCVGGDAVLAAVREVRASACQPVAVAYRQQLAVAGPVRMGVVVQEMVAADVAGVLFTRNPVTGADELVVEASWGLGEAVVAGLVTPDHVRATSDGTVLDRVLGDKDVAIRLTPQGVPEETAVPAALASLPCLSDEDVRALAQLARACDDVYGGTAHDVEFAFAGGRLFLLQRRPITHG
jgi:pyruvate,water dikinase